MNYFSYFSEIEDTFIRRRGKHLLLSPIDWALIESWKERGVPLHVVVRAIEHAFDSYESKKHKRTVKTLLYCQEEVEAQYAEWLESRVGSHDDEGVAEEADDPLAPELESIWKEEWQKNIIDAAMERVKRRANPQHYQIFYLHLVKKHGAAAVADACAAALELGVAEYRFVRRYLERHAPAPLTLRQVDPLIRQLTHYRDVIARKTEETPS